LSVHALNGFPEGNSDLASAFRKAFLIFLPEWSKLSLMGRLPSENADGLRAKLLGRSGM
jgi:hypothetical protein